jgi:ribosomal protein S18 acetylase RimI-like enzyme
MANKYQLRPATRNDRAGIENLLGYKVYLHRHLDWRTPFDWLGSQPYWVISEDSVIYAALACPADPPGISWIRFFSVMPGIQLKYAWKLLFEKALASFDIAPHIIATVTVQDWYKELLLDYGFKYHQSIVVLSWQESSHSLTAPRAEVTLRRMHDEDLEIVAAVDQSAFDPLWQNSLEGTQRAFQESDYSIVALQQDEIVAYQMSSSTPFNAHLARLAVLPEMQGKGVGYALTYDMVQHFRFLGIGYITVNTQHDNYASLALYEKLGFRLTQDEFPVLRYDLDPTK